MGWYRGQFDASKPWWTPSTYNLSSIDAADPDFWYWGYRACALQNVADCESPWNFYWQVGQSMHADVEFESIVGECSASVTTQTPIDFGIEYEYVCVDIVDLDNDSLLDANDCIGAYEIERELTNCS